MYRSVYVRRRKKLQKRALILAGAVLAVLILVGYHMHTIAAENAYEEATVIPPESHTDKSNILLVNWDNPVSDERPEGLVLLESVFGDEVTVENGKASINKEAGDAAKKMFEAARREGMCKYIITSTYRSVSYQTELWNKRIEQDPDYGKDPYNNPVRCMPGNMSEHSTGLAMDVVSENFPWATDDFADTEEGKWLKNNAHKFGFILRYPADKQHITGVIYEPWHYRYIGVDAATDMYYSGECLEEYLH